MVSNYSELLAPGRTIDFVRYGQISEIGQQLFVAEHVHVCMIVKVNAPVVIYRVLRHRLPDPWFSYRMSTSNPDHPHSHGVCNGICIVYLRHYLFFVSIDRMDLSLRVLWLISGLWFGFSIRFPFWFSSDDVLMVTVEVFLTTMFAPTHLFQNSTSTFCRVLLLYFEDMLFSKRILKLSRCK